MLAYVTTAQAAPREKITQISVQRTECYGACPVDGFILNADGSATYASLRGGLKPVGSYSGHSDSKTFQTIADWLETQNFFVLHRQVGWGNIDSSDFIVSVRRDFRTFTVAFRYGEFDEIRHKFEDKLLPLAKTIDWQKDEAAFANGVRGYIKRTFTLAERMKAGETTGMQFVVVTARPYGNLKQEYTTVTDQIGQFKLFLPPGRYDIQVQGDNDAASNVPSFLPPILWHGEPVSVTVNKGAFAFVQTTLKPNR